MIVDLSPSKVRSDSYLWVYCRDIYEMFCCCCFVFVLFNLLLLLFVCLFFNILLHDCPFSSLLDSVSRPHEIEIRPPSVHAPVMLKPAVWITFQI